MWTQRKIHFNKANVKETSTISMAQDVRPVKDLPILSLSFTISLFASLSFLSGSCLKSLDFISSITNVLFRLPI